MKNHFIRPLAKGMGEAVAKRTVLRPEESWGDVADRVAIGNAGLHPRTGINDIFGLRKHIANASILMSGRHLQHGDITQPGRNMEVFTNCSSAAASHVEFLLLLNGSGVGRSYDDAMMIVDWAKDMPEILNVLHHTHPDFNADIHTCVHAYTEQANDVYFRVPDSREGWAQAAEKLEMMTYAKRCDKRLVLDWSDVRERGALIGGMQDRPAAGPVPTMEAFAAIAGIRGRDLEPWLSTIIVDHHFAACVVVGGARRAARMAVKFWKDPGIFKYINLKNDYRDADGYPLYWSANYSIGVDQEFWDQAKVRGSHAWLVLDAATRASYFHLTGEPGFINLDKIQSSEEGIEELYDGEYIFSDKFLPQAETKLFYADLLRASEGVKYKYITNPCGEIRLRITGGYCVDGSTRILHRGGYDEISTLVGKEIEVWNGEKWSKTTPFKTGENQKLLRVKFSDGSFLDCTPYHKFSVKKSRQGKNFKEVEAKDLWAGAFLPTFRVDTDITGGQIIDAYTYGAFLGDGSIENRSDSTGKRYQISLYKGKHHLPVTGTRTTEQANTGIRVTVSHLDVSKLESLKEDKLPDWVFNMDRVSTIQFIQGWIDTDGCFHKDTGGISVSTESAQRATDLQLLLRRVGISFASSKQVAKAGDKTNFGERTKGLSLVYIPESEAAIINGFRVASDRKINLDRVVRQQRVASVEELPGLHDTFCFTEPERHMGVFNNVLTHQCVIADVVPYFLETMQETVEAFVMAGRALIRTNLMNSLYSKEVKRTNRIGLGWTGFHEWAWKNFNASWMDLVNPDHELWKVVSQIRDRVSVALDEYCDELGVARCHTKFTFKPAGTTSKLFDLTEGAHLPAVRAMIRWVQFRNGDPLIKQYRDNGFPIRELTSYADTTIVGYPMIPSVTKLIPDAFLVTATEATPQEQYQYLRNLEANWADNQISYTLKIDVDKVSYEEYLETIINNQSTVACCSVMPFSSKGNEKYEYLPEEPVSLEQIIEILDGISDDSLKEEIDMESLRCSAGVCPL